MNIHQINQLISLLEHLEFFIDDSYYAEISECKRCVVMLRKEKEKLEALQITQDIIS